MQIGRDIEIKTGHQAASAVLALVVSEADALRQPNQCEPTLLLLLLLLERCERLHLH
jgi:hypothetical protein